MALHNRILLGLVLGAVAGVATNGAFGHSAAVERIVHYGTEPLWKMWLSSLIMIVIPLILSTLSLGVAGLGNLKRLGRIGVLTLLCFLSLTTLSTMLGLAVMNTVQRAGPGPAITTAHGDLQGTGQEPWGCPRGLRHRPAGGSLRATR
jgi:DAACS family dicarboxylate/amino acid:cation (Na+ or H+) symporter